MTTKTTREMTYDPSQIEAYLNVLGLDAKSSMIPTSANLHRLVEANITHIPYENLFIHYNSHPMSMEYKVLLDRMLGTDGRGAGRGSYCMGLNGVFGQVLSVT